jgi:hypothetical protein
MKKYVLICVFMLFSLFMFTSSNYVHSCYSVKCAKCVEAVHESHCPPGIAWRSTEPYKKEGDKVYALYKCCYGHKYWAELK